MVVGGGGGGGGGWRRPALNHLSYQGSCHNEEIFSVAGGGGGGGGVREKF